MSLFSSLFASDAEPSVHFDSEEEAIYAILYAVAHIDGLTDSELSIMIKILGVDPSFSHVNWADMLNATKQKAEKAGGSAALVKPAMAKLGEESKLMTFIYAVDIVIADGIMGSKEEDLLRVLRHGFDISEDVAVGIIKALIYKLKSR